METQATIRINLSTQELEISGSESFVEKYSRKLGELIDSLGTGSKLPEARLGRLSSVEGADRPNGEIPETFGEYFHSVPNTATSMDQILVAGHFAQLKSDENSFATNDASTLLLDQGVKLANPSTSISRNLEAKYLIKLTKGKFRVSREGTDRIAAIFGNIVDA